MAIKLVVSIVFWSMLRIEKDGLGCVRFASVISLDDRTYLGDLSVCRRQLLYHIGVVAAREM